jgi:hypothetical protein
VRRSFILLGLFFVSLPFACGGGGAIAPAPPPTFTVTFQAGPHGALSGTLVQTVPYGGSCTPVSALPDNTYAFADWSGAGIAANLANPLTVDNVTADLTITADFLSAIPDLESWLLAHDNVAAAIRWQFRSPAGGNAYTPPGAADMIAWADWSQVQKDALAAAYLDAAAWLLNGASTAVSMPRSGVSDAPTNYYSPQGDSGAVMQWVSPADMWNLYLSHVAFSLALETTHAVPWSLTTYSAESLRYLLDSGTMGWKLPYSPVSFSLGTYGGANLPTFRADNRPKTTFAHPMWTYGWMSGAGIIGSTRLASIGGVLDWMRHNMAHFYGAETFGICDNVWGYRGYPPLSRIVGGTVDAGNPLEGAQHWTMGCHGSVGFLAATLRALNIPVQPVWVGGHELACFLTERLYLDHGDDPYNQVVKGSASPILNVLIDEATYQSRFTPDLTVNLNNPGPGVVANIGKAAADFR